MIVHDLGLVRYRDAWARQERAHASVAAGEAEQLLMVEHPPVITLGRRPGGAGHLLASADRLAEMGVEVVETDRGGDVTFHGPGQIVAYPIVRLIDHQLSVGGYVRRLEEAVIAVLGDFGIRARKDEAGVGVWVDQPESASGLNRGAKTAAKICALGVRIRRGVSMHGLALNVETDLRYFDLIVPCGIAGRAVTSMRRLLGDRTPAMEAVRAGLTQRVEAAFSPGQD